MLKVKFNNLGSPDNELYVSEELLDKKLEAFEVLIEVLFFPINPADLLLVEGKYANKPKLPSSIGAECIARVKEVGNKVKRFKAGDIVLPLSRDNWTQEKIAKEDELINIQKDINILQASMLKVNPATAYLMLNNYLNINKGDFIIQNASNSGVGNYIIQLCKIYGIKSINFVRRMEIEDNLKNMGADYVFNLNSFEDKKEFIKKAKAKLFIDAIAGNKLNSVAELLTENAQIINYGLLSDEPMQLDAHNTIFKNITLKGFWLTLWLMRMPPKEKDNLYKYLAKLVLEEKIFTPIQKVFYISDIKEAAKLAGNYNRSGKILVTPNKALYEKYKN